MSRAAVVYEARRKNRAVKPLRWHRLREGIYQAEGARARYTVFHRKPNRRQGRFPWTVARGGMRGDELKAGGFDLKEQAQEYAALFDQGLCGAAPEAGAGGIGAGGTFPGTLAGEGGQKASKGYTSEVIIVLSKIGIPPSAQIDDEYVARMEMAGIEPSITAAVLAGTTRHAHVHDAPGKHVVVSEGASERREDHIFRGHRITMIESGHRWRYELPSTGFVSGWFESKDAAWASAQKKLGMPAGFSMAVEGKEAKEAKEAKRIQVWDFPGERGYYALVRGPDGYMLYLDDSLIQSWSESEATPESIKAWAKRFDAEGSEAEEAKKRLWQPDPSTGLFITRSSLTRDYWVMKGDHVKGRFSSRGEAESFAKDLSSPKA
jgi:hypothetical protein